MKKIILCFVSIVIGGSLYAQVRVKAPAEKIIAPYDSLVNGLPFEKVKAYIGQSFYVKPSAESLRENGYRDFYTEPTSSYKAVYSRMKEYGPSTTKYEALAGKTLDIIGVKTKGTGVDMQTYLELTDGADTIYYEYPRSVYESSIPFLITGYVEKLNELYVGNSYYLIKQPDEYWTDFETGKDVKLISASLWKCAEVVLDGKYYRNLMFVLKNDKGQTISDEMERVVNEVDFIPKKTGDSYKKKHGVAAFLKMMNGL